VHSRPTSVESAAKAYQAEVSAVTDLNSQLTDLIDQINAANGVGQDAVTTNARYQSVLEGLSAEVEKNGTTLDQNTAAGSANAAALAELAGSAQTAAQAQFEQDQATMSADAAATKYLDTLATQRQAFIDSAVGAGYNAGEVSALADQIFRMPTEKEFEAIVETATAQGELDRFVNLNNGRRVKVFVDAEGGQSFRVGTTTVAPGMSSGGPVLGPGPRGKDSELRMLAPGEHVLTAQEVTAAGGHGAIEEWRSALTGARSDYALTADSREHVMEIPSAKLGRSKGERS
jgi:hypothetical protein